MRINKGPINGSSEKMSDASALHLVNSPPLSSLLYTDEEIWSSVRAGSCIIWSSLSFILIEKLVNLLLFHSFFLPAESFIISIQSTGTGKAEGSRVVRRLPSDCRERLRQKPHTSGIQKRPSKVSGPQRLLVSPT